MVILYNIYVQNINQNAVIEVSHKVNINILSTSISKLLSVIIYYFSLRMTIKNYLSG